MKSVEQRLGELEKSVRRSRFIMGGLILALIAGYGWEPLFSPRVNAAVEQENVVRCQRLELVDQEGKVRAGLGITEGRPRLTFFDSKGRARAVMNEGGLALSDQGGAVRAALDLRADQDPRLRLSSPDNQMEVRLGIEGERAGFYLYNQQRARARLEAGLNVTTLALNDARSTRQAGMVINEQDLKLFLGTAERELVRLDARPDRSGLVMNDLENIRRARLMVGGQGAEVSLSAQGRELARLEARTDLTGLVLNDAQEIRRAGMLISDQDLKVYLAKQGSELARLEGKQNGSNLILSGGPESGEARMGVDGLASGLFLSPAGKPAAVLEAQPDKMGLEFLNSEEKVQLGVRVINNLPRVDLADQRGAVRATLGTTLAGDPSLALFDEQVKKRAVFRTAAGRGMLGMSSAGGEQILTIAEEGKEGGDPSLRLERPGQGSRAVLELSEKQSGLRLSEPGKKREIALGWVEMNGPALALGGEEGKPRAGIEENAGNLRLYFSDGEGRPRVELGFREEVSDLAFYNPAGKKRIRLGTEQEGGDPKLKFFDREGELMALMGYAEISKSPEVCFYNNLKKSQVMLMLADGMPFFMLTDMGGESLFQAP